MNLKILIIDDEPEIRLSTIKNYLNNLSFVRNFEGEIIFTHLFVVPERINYDIVSFDGDGGVYGDYLQQLKDCKSVKINNCAFIHTLNPIKAKEFVFVLKDLGIRSIRYPYSQMIYKGSHTK